MRKIGWVKNQLSGSMKLGPGVTLGEIWTRDTRGTHVVQVHL